MQVDAGQLGIVVEHLFKVGHEPMVVNGVAVESAPQLIVHPATGHRLQGLGHHLQRPGGTREVVIAQQELEGHRLGEFRPIAPPAVDAVKAFQ